jgi:hypothetical protein
LTTGSKKKHANERVGLTIYSVNQSKTTQSVMKQHQKLLQRRV